LPVHGAARRRSGAILEQRSMNRLSMDDATLPVALQMHLARLETSALARVSLIAAWLLLARVPPIALRVAQTLLARHQRAALERALSQMSGRVLRESGLLAVLRDEARSESSRSSCWDE
jgi:hypothetical protein